MIVIAGSVSFDLSDRADVPASLGRLTGATASMDAASPADGSERPPAG
ncbi:MAG: hypothetical protein ACLPYY_03500 [Acidimicrobiales bacterium]